MISRSFKDHSKFNFTSIIWSTDASTFRCQAPGESLKIGYKAGNWSSPSFNGWADLIVAFTIYTGLVDVDSNAFAFPNSPQFFR